MINTCDEEERPLCVGLRQTRPKVNDANDQQRQKTCEESNHDPKSDMLSEFTTAVMLSTIEKLAEVERRTNHAAISAQPRGTDQAPPTGVA
jgi:hypothetical protein